MLSKSALNIFYIFLIFITGLLIFSTSCKTSIQNSDETIVAKAFDRTLLKSEVDALFGPSMSKQDSFLIARGYIESWLQKQVMLHYGSESDLGSSEEINRKVEDFREDLLTFEYRKKLLSEKLDTNITFQETKAYYLEHPENFELKQNIIRFVFIKMPLALENKHKFWNRFGKADPEELTNMAMLALKNGGNAYLEKETWLAFDDILKVVPINTYNQENFINNNRLFKIDEKDFVWYVNILEFRIRDNISPFEFVEDNIHEILLNKRKVEFLEKLENTMVQKARNEDQIKVYLPQYD